MLLVPSGVTLSPSPLAVSEADEADDADDESEEDDESDADDESEEVDCTKKEQLLSVMPPTTRQLPGEKLQASI